VRLARIFMLVALLTFGCAMSAPQTQFPPAPKLDHFDVDAADRSLDACTDFYKFACSKWMATNPIPADQAVWSTGFGSNLDLWNETVLRDAMIEASAVSANRTPVQQKIGDYWVACMNESAIDAAGVKPIQPLLAMIDGMKSKAELAAGVARLHMSFPGAWVGDANETFAPVLGFGSNIDFKNAQLMVAGFDQGGMGLPGRNYYVEDNPKLKEVRAAYLEHIRKSLMLAGEAQSQAESDAVTVLAIETSLAHVSMDNVRRRDPANIYNVRTLAQIKALTPSFNFDAYLKAVGAPTPKFYIVSEPQFFSGLEEVIRAESLDHWKAYLRWWTVQEASPYLSQPFVDESFAFYGKALTGAQQLRPRWRRCVRFADRDLGEAVGQAYVSKAFPPESKRRMDTLIHDVESALRDDIRQLDWMTPATKEQAEIKLKGILDKIGYPSKWRDYSSMKVGRDYLVENVHQATVYEFHRQLEKVGRPVDRQEWDMTPPTINAYYNGQMNTINFPAGILQPPFFDPQVGDAANYGAIGMVIGHEISHGFDDQGRKFDATGNMRDWWTPQDAKQYEQRDKCITDEYTADIPELGVKQNGLLTAGEDSADNAGLRIALLALEKHYKNLNQSIDVRDPDGFTPRQKFFLAHAFSWCTNIRPEIARTQVVTNPHSLPMFRINNVESNMPEFWQAFGCKQGQTMVRQNACKVW
jgi:putative endopeptidase